jgi:hypothetical protein
MKLIELTRVCNRCGERKVWNIGFYKNRSGRLGVSYTCKLCAKFYVKEYYKANSEERKAYSKKYCKDNKKKVAASLRKYSQINREKLSINQKKHRVNNKKRILEREKRHREAHKEERNAYSREYGRTHKKERSIYRKNKTRTDPKYNLNDKMSNLIKQSLKNGKEWRSWKTLVQYTLDDLKKHIQKQFTEGMTWELFLDGKIHIDHKIPVSVFNYTKPEHLDFQKCWALKNLQPLWAKENMSKSAKLTKHFQPSLLL